MNKRLFKNIKNKTLKKCSMKPLTGYNRDVSYINGSGYI